MALAIVGVPNISGHFEKLEFVVIIVQCFSYLLAISWKNRLEASRFIGKYSTDVGGGHLVAESPDR